MRKEWCLWTVTALLLGSAFTPTKKIPHPSAEPASWILVISDVHLSVLSTPSKFGDDTHADLWAWTLKKLDSVLQGKGEYHKPAFILCTGDLPCHKSNEGDPQKRAQLARSVKETLQKKAANAGVPIVFAAGNNDYPEEDYCAMDSGYFARTLNSKGKKIRIIALNTVPYSPSDRCEAGKKIRQHDLDDQMTWLDGQLQQIGKDEKAILIMHIPPGKDGFKSARSLSLWSDSATLNGRTVQQQFLDIVAAHKDKIAGILAGHSHKDGLRMLYNADTAAGVLLAVPSISPVYNNNPGFKMIAYDPSSLEWTNCVTYYTDLDDYMHTGKWNAHQYDLHTTLSLEAGPLSSAIAKLSKDSARLIESIRPIYYVKSKCPGVDAMDSIERTVFVRSPTQPHDFTEDFNTPSLQNFRYGSTGARHDFKWQSGVPSSSEPNTKVLLFKIDPADSAGAGRGPEIISKEFTYYGTYSARIKIPDVRKIQPNTGAVVGYFTYNMDHEKGLSEIDIEWLVADPRIIYIGTWTGFEPKLQRIGRTIDLANGHISYTISKIGYNGQPTTQEGLQNQPETVPAIPNFDASAQFYTYGFDWYPDRLTWWIIQPKTGEKIILWDYKGSTLGIPQNPSKYRMNFWHTSTWYVETNPDSKEKPLHPYELEVDWMKYEPFK